MKKNIKTISDLEKELGTTEQCLEYLYVLRWPNGFICPHCKHTEASVIDKAKYKYKCKENSCRKPASITSGTLFQDTPYNKLPLWFHVIWDFSSLEINMSLLQKKYQTSYTTPWKMVEKLKALCFLTSLESESQTDLFHELLEKALKSRPMPYRLIRDFCKKMKAQRTSECEYSNMTVYSEDGCLDDY